MSRTRIAMAALAGMILSLACQTVGYSQTLDQDKVTAAMVLRILNFVEWPNEKPQITIGVFQDQEVFQIFQSLADSEIYQNRYRIVALDNEHDPNPQIDVLFFPHDHPRAVPRLIRRLQQKPIVFIGGHDGFLQQGGTVNIITRQKRMSFEINVAQSRPKGITFRAKLLRLASKVIDE